MNKIVTGTYFKYSFLAISRMLVYTNDFCCAAALNCAVSVWIPRVRVTPCRRHKISYVDIPREKFSNLQIRYRHAWGGPSYLSFIISFQILKPLINLGRMFPLDIAQGTYLASDGVSLRLDGWSDVWLCLGDGSAQCILHLGHCESWVGSN